MTTRTIVKFSLTALLMSGTVVGCATHQGGVASLSTSAQGRAMSLAADAADKARRALAKDKGLIAVSHAEAAVGWQPQSPEYRMLLAQSYMRAGRFQSARDVFSEVLVLTPNDGRAALNLALAQTALGDWEGARVVLDSHAEVIPASDRGLAMALAGDPISAVELLLQAVRQPDADAKTRQNLALSLAMVGRWNEARAVAAYDVPANEIDARMLEWAGFANPRNASDQVASLIGVTPVQDAGRPVALALNPDAQPKTIQQAVTPLDVPVAPFVDVPAEVAANTVAPTPAVEVIAAQQIAAQPVAAAQPLPATRTIAAPAFSRPSSKATPRPVAKVRIARTVIAKAKVTKAVKVAARAPVAPPAVSRGAYFIQLGAYNNAAVARDGWVRATRRYAAFAGKTPSGVPIAAKGGNFYRLSVGGFSREQAVSMCTGYRRVGGSCFVRMKAGDQVARWAPVPVRQLASR